jgi:hypothetical protein
MPVRVCDVREMGLRIWQNTAAARVEKDYGCFLSSFLKWKRARYALSVRSKGQMHEYYGNYGISADDEFITFASLLLLNPYL